MSFLALSKAKALIVAGVLGLGGVAGLAVSSLPESTQSATVQQPKVLTEVIRRTKHVKPQQPQPQAAREPGAAASGTVAAGSGAAAAAGTASSPSGGYDDDHGEDEDHEDEYGAEDGGEDDD
jgi:hypothetical protein